MKVIDNCASVSTDSLTVTLHNTRSSRKHASGEVINNSDIILRTETQIAPGDNTVPIFEILKDFDIVQNISSDKFCSIGCCYINTINFVDDNIMSLLKIQKSRQFLSDYSEYFINIKEKQYQF